MEKHSAERSRSSFTESEEEQQSSLESPEQSSELCSKRERQGEGGRAKTTKYRSRVESEILSLNNSHSLVGNTILRSKLESFACVI